MPIGRMYLILNPMQPMSLTSDTANIVECKCFE